MLTGAGGWGERQGPVSLECQKCAVRPSSGCGSTKNVLSTLCSYLSPVSLVWQEHPEQAVLGPQISNGQPQRPAGDARIFRLLRALVLLTSYLCCHQMLRAERPVQGLSWATRTEARTECPFWRIELGSRPGGRDGIIKKGVCKGCPKRGGGSLEEDTGTGNMGYPNLGKEKGWNSEQKCLWEAGEELGCLAGVPELRLGCRAALEGLSRGKRYGPRVVEC